MLGVEDAELLEETLMRQRQFREMIVCQGDISTRWFYIWSFSATQGVIKLPNMVPSAALGAYPSLPVCAYVACQCDPRFRPTSIRVKDTTTTSNLSRKHHEPSVIEHE